MQVKNAFSKPRIGAAVRRNLDKFMVTLIVDSSPAINQTVSIAETTESIAPSPVSLPKEPPDEPGLASLKTLIHNQLIVKWLAKHGVNNIKGNYDLTVDSMLQSINDLHRELHCMHHEWVAKLCNSKPLPVDAEKYI
jgi:hypothetical protein